MKRKISKKKGAVISLVLLLAMTGLFVFLVVTFWSDDKSGIGSAKDESNTVEFTAIVQRVEVKDESVHVYIDGYDWYLSAGVKVKEKDLRKKFTALKPGEKVYYRIASWYFEKHPDFPNEDVNFYVDFVTLRTETEEILSLSDYNRIVGRNTTILRIFVFSLAVLAFGGACYCVWVLCKKDKKAGTPSECINGTNK